MGELKNGHDSESSKSDDEDEVKRPGRGSTKAKKYIEKEESDLSEEESDQPTTKVISSASDDNFSSNMVVIKRKKAAADLGIIEVESKLNGKEEIEASTEGQSDGFSSKSQDETNEDSEDESLLKRRKKKSQIMTSADETFEGVEEISSRRNKKRFQYAEEES